MMHSLSMIGAAFSGWKWRVCSHHDIMDDVPAASTRALPITYKMCKKPPKKFSPSARMLTTARCTPVTSSQTSG